MLTRGALWHLACSQGAGVALASPREPMTHASQNSAQRLGKERETVRFGFGMRQAALLLIILAMALGGCGTLSGGLQSESMLAATSARSTEATDPADPVAAAL